MTNSELANLLRPLAGACSGPLDDNRIKAFHAVLGDLPALAVAAAVKTYLMTAEDRWWPMPSTIRRLVLKHAAGRHLSSDEAWAMIETASRTWTRHDPARAKAATAGIPADVLQLFRSLGGFVTLQESDPTGASVMRSHFLKLWQERTEQAETERATPEPLRTRITEAPNPAARIVAERLKVESKARKA